jgi:hypothetical protein
VRCTSYQRRQQGLGVLQVGGVKPLGEPVVDRCQQLTGFGTLALLLLQARETHGRPQLQGFGLLAAGNIEGLVETGLRFSPRLPAAICLMPCACLFQQQFSLEPIQLRLPVALPTVVDHGQRLGHQGKPLFGLPHSPVCLGQQGKQKRPSQLCPRSPPGGQALMHLCYPLRSLPLRRQRPPSQESSHRQPMRKPCSVESVMAASACSWKSSRLGRL